MGVGVDVGANANANANARDAIRVEVNDGDIAAGVGVGAVDVVAAAVDGGCVYVAAELAAGRSNADVAGAVADEREAIILDLAWWSLDQLTDRLERIQLNRIDPQLNKSSVRVVGPLQTNSALISTLSGMNQLGDRCRSTTVNGAATEAAAAKTLIRAELSNQRLRASGILH